MAEDLALVADPLGMENSQAAPSYAPQGGGFVSGGSNHASTSAASSATSAPPGQRTKEEMWESYFADPSQWWDNRQGKVRVCVLGVCNVDLGKLGLKRNSEVSRKRLACFASCMESRSRSSELARFGLD